MRFCDRIRDLLFNGVINFETPCSWAVQKYLIKLYSINNSKMFCLKRLITKRTPPTFYPTSNIIPWKRFHQLLSIIGFIDNWIFINKNSNQFFMSVQTAICPNQSSGTNETFYQYAISCLLFITTYLWNISRKYCTGCLSS